MCQSAHRSASSRQRDGAAERGATRPDHSQPARVRRVVRGAGARRPPPRRGPPHACSPHVPRPRCARHARRPLPVALPQPRPRHGDPLGARRGAAARARSGGPAVGLRARARPDVWLEDDGLQHVGGHVARRPAGATRGGSGRDGRGVGRGGGRGEGGGGAPHACRREARRSLAASRSLPHVRSRRARGRDDSVALTMSRGVLPSPTWPRRGCATVQLLPTRPRRDWSFVQLPPALRRLERLARSHRRAARRAAIAEPDVGHVDDP